MFHIFFILLSISVISFAEDCKPSITTASGPAAPSTICSGDLIFDENFDTLDKTKWKPEVTFWGGGNGEFQWYVADDENSFAQDGKLYIKPTLTANKIGYNAIETSHVVLDDCTDQNLENCERQAGGNVIINPVRSARLLTKDSFSFKYGRIEVIAKMPKGDWLWPAIWLLPTQWKFGEWPRSGEIDLIESRGNIKYGNEVQIGVEQVSTTLHFGPRWDQDAYRTASFSRNNASGYHSDFHKYEFVWDDSGIRCFIDGNELGFIGVDEGFWKRGEFQGENIWENAGKMAPFNEEFHFILNLAIGGTNGFFPDIVNLNGRKPWDNNSPSAMKDFWTYRDQWLRSWRPREDASLVVDSIKVWAI